MNDSPAIEEAFAAVPLFARLNRGQRARLARFGTTRAYRPGSIIVRQGDTSMALYVVLAGRVGIEQESDVGAPLRVHEVGACGFFGEMGLIDDMPRSATVVALEPTVCVLLAKWDFRNELRHDPDIALALLPILTQRLRQATASGSQAPPASVAQPLTGPAAY